MTEERVEIKRLMAMVFVFFLGFRKKTKVKETTTMELRDELNKIKII